MSESVTPLLQVHHLMKRFRMSRAAGQPRRPGGSYLHAVDDVSFAIAQGESVGLVGESGCGKSTLVRLITRLLDPDAGRILFAGRDLGQIPARQLARHADRARVQQVFQDAGEALDPRATAFAAIAEPLRLLAGLRGDALDERVHALADDVTLPHALLGRYPHQLSGGQRARVGIARALALRPDLLVLDEPTASLDVSVQAVVLQLLAGLRVRHGVTYLFVTHDLSLVRLLCDRVLVMYLGQIVESGPVARVFGAPAHPYTRALLAAVPDWRAPPGLLRLRLSGEPGSPIDPRSDACRLAGRCPMATERCTREAPALARVGVREAEHRAACHFVADPGAPTSTRAAPTANEMKEKKETSCVQEASH